MAMSKTQRELAFLRDLSITYDWTERFTNLVDEHLEVPKKGKFLYVNIGTGNHALALRERIKDEVEFFGVSENEDLLSISQAKADAVKADVNFQASNTFPQNSFDAVLADAMMVRPRDLRQFMNETIQAAKPAGDVSFFLPTAGSFGEIFSYLWETFFTLELPEYGAEVERLITEITTVSQVEEMAQNAGLKKVESQTKNEIFEYDTGEEFVNSALIQDYLLPVWLDFLTESEKKRVAKKLVQIVDADREGITFRFTVKATLVSGEKAK
jgi:ubiquinone/menaquinone biosynthesis C-methylase UbiE